MRAGHGHKLLGNLNKYRSRAGRKSESCRLTGAGDGLGSGNVAVGNIDDDSAGGSARRRNSDSLQASDITSLGGRDVGCGKLDDDSALVVTVGRDGDGCRLGNSTSAGRYLSDCDVCRGQRDQESQ